MESEQFWARLLYLLEILMILIALIFTYSAGAWIGVLVGILAFIFLMGRIRYSIPLILLIVTLAVIAFTVFPSQIAVLLSHASDQSELSLHTGDWQTSIRVIEAFPLFGVGLGDQAYLVRADSYRVPAQTVPLAEPDNSYLQWGATSGIPAMLVFLLLLGFVFWFAYRNWLIIDSLHRPLIAGGIAALIVLSVNSLSVDAWTGPNGIANLGWLIAGVVTSPLIGSWLRQGRGAELVISCRDNSNE